MAKTAQNEERGLGPVGSKRRRILFFGVFGALGFFALIAFRGVLTPFALGVIVAYVLAPLVRQLERIQTHSGGPKMPRWLAVLLLYAGLLGAMGAGVTIALPRLAAETQRLVREIPTLVRRAQNEGLPHLERILREASTLANEEGESATAEAEEVASEEPSGAAVAPEEAAAALRIVPAADGSYRVELPEEGVDIVQVENHHYRLEVNRGDAPRDMELSSRVVQAFRGLLRETEATTGELIRQAQLLASKIVSSIFKFFLMLMISAYLLITSDRILAFFRALARPERQRAFDHLVARVDRGLAGVVRGQLLIALVNGVLSGVGFWLADLRYWPILTLIATVLSIIPIFGAILSSIPAVLIGLQQGVPTALFVLAWIIGIHQLEANLFNPKIMGDAAKVHPVLVIFALLAGEHLFGIIGALLAVPLLSISQSVFLHFREIALGVPKDHKVAAEWAEATLDRAPKD